MRWRRETCATLGADRHARHRRAGAVGHLRDAQAQKRATTKQAPQRPPAVAKEAPHTQIEEIKREQQPGATRIGAGRRVGAQRRRDIELQRHRDRHLRRGRQQPAAERRVRLLRRPDRGGRRAGPPGRAAQEQRGRAVAQHLVGHLRPGAQLLRHRLDPPHRRDHDRGVQGLARRRLPEPALHAGLRPGAGALHRGPEGLPPGRSCASSRSRACTCRTSTASPSSARACSAPPSSCPPT